MFPFHGEKTLFVLVKKKKNVPLGNEVKLNDLLFNGEILSLQTGTSNGILFSLRTKKYSHTHTHLPTYIYMHTYILTQRYTRSLIHT